MICPLCQTDNLPHSGSCTRCGTLLAPLDGATLEISGDLPAFIGADFGPRYHVLSLLGTGGMGKVYKAEDKELGRIVAIKVLRADLIADPQAQQRFKQELLLASRISHPNILRIHDLAEYKEVKFISMAFVDGGDLSKLLTAGARLAPERAIKLMEQLCEALGAAHNQGVIHRDLKPQNILLEKQDHVLVADFGLAKTLELNGTGMTRTGAILGTPAYMSPEQVEGKLVDHRSDIYSLGLILYEMLTGVLPFTGDSTFQLMYQRVHQLPKRPELITPSLDSSLSQLCMRCLEKDPCTRYQSTAEILKDLRSGTVSKVALTRELSSQSPSPLRRWILAIGVLTVVALTLSAPSIRKYFVAGNAIPRARQDVPSVSNPKSLVLLPLQTSGGKSALDYQAPGITEALYTKLAKLKALHVGVLPSTGKFNLPQSQPNIAKELGAGWMLSGSLNETFGKLKIQLNLRDLQTGGTTWTKVFSGIPADLLTIEDEIYSSIITALGLEPTSEEFAVGAARPTENIEAYDYYLRGRAAIRNQHDVKSAQMAIGLYEQALKKDSGFALAYCGLSDAYLDTYASTKDTSLPDKALGAALQAEQLSENRPEVHLSLGSVYMATGKSAEAIVEFKRALQLAPGSDEGYRRLGSAYRTAGRKDDAIQAYRHALQINPFYWLNYSQYGAALLEFGDDAAGRSAFQRVIELDPQNSLGYSNLGIIYYRQGAFEQSILMFQKAIELQPTAEAFSNLGTSYSALKRYSEAITMYAKAVELQPGSQDYTGNLAEAYRFAGQTEKANSAYDKALELAFKEYRVNPLNVDTLASIALYYSKKGDSSRGLEFIRRARAIKPDDVTLIDDQAEIYALSGRTEDAISSVRDALAKGYSVEDIKNDPDLQSLQSRPRFQKLLAEAKPK